ncbi:hypothetical protein BDR06DRAFT_971951 [Suillus hirtellus]|nr:hypothetical protein BDR06DRAFT_971951 [Suillus hirtellus]
MTLVCTLFQLYTLRRTCLECKLMSYCIPPFVWWSNYWRSEKMIRSYSEGERAKAPKYKKKYAAETIAWFDADETFNSSDMEKETPAEFTCWYQTKEAHKIMDMQSREIRPNFMY